MQNYFAINPSVFRLFVIAGGLLLFWHWFAVLYWYIARDHVGFGAESAFVPDAEMVGTNAKYMHATTCIVHDLAYGIHLAHTCGARTRGAY